MKAKMAEKEQEVKLMIDSVAAEELENLRKKHKNLIEENNELSIKVGTRIMFFLLKELQPY